MHAKIDKKSKKNGISCDVKLLKEKSTWKTALILCFTAFYRFKCFI